MTAVGTRGRISPTPVRPDVASSIDALYFTVTALTTTGSATSRCRAPAGCRGTPLNVPDEDY
jgi:hypothetical protein